MKVIADYSEGRDNNFGLIRLFAALFVMLSHSYVLAGTAAQDPLSNWVRVTFRGIGVNSFFVISGFLVAGSFCRSRNVVEYLRSRFLRILPGLFVAVLFSALVVGGLFTSLHFTDYLSRREVWEFIVINSTLVLDKIQLRYLLPGVFASNPYQYTVNGSLWTLPYEMWLYVVLMLIGVVGLFKKRSMLNLLLLVSFSMYFIAIILFPTNQWLHKLDNFGKFGHYFFAGTIAYINRDMVPLSTVLWIILVAGAVLTRGTAIFQALSPLVLIYSVFWLAYIPGGWIRNYNRIGDYSYGTYLYAFPVQQSLVALIGGIQPLQLFVLALPVTLGLAILSWYFIEKPALSRKRSVARAADSPRRALKGAANIEL